MAGIGAKGLPMQHRWFAAITKKCIKIFEFLRVFWIFWPIKKAFLLPFFIPAIDAIYEKVWFRLKHWFESHYQSRVKIPWVFLSKLKSVDSFASMFDTSQWHIFHNDFDFSAILASICCGTSVLTLLACLSHLIDQDTIIEDNFLEQAFKIRTSIQNQLGHFQLGLSN